MDIRIAEKRVRGNLFSDELCRFLRAFLQVHRVRHSSLPDEEYHLPDGHIRGQHRRLPSENLLVEIAREQQHLLFIRFRKASGQFYGITQGILHLNGVKHKSIVEGEERVSRPAVSCAHEQRIIGFPFPEELISSEQWPLIRFG